MLVTQAGATAALLRRSSLLAGAGELPILLRLGRSAQFGGRPPRLGSSTNA